MRCDRVKESTVSVWIWIAIGAGSFLVVSLFVDLALGAVLGSIGQGISELYETEDWAMAPPARALADAEPEPGEAETKQDRVVRLRRPRGAPAVSFNNPPGMSTASPARRESAGSDPRVSHAIRVSDQLQNSAP